jgi:hypothetical protein
VTARGLPPLTALRQPDTHRLIPSRHAEPESVLGQIADDDSHLADLFAIDNATNDRVAAEHGRALDIGPEELVFDVPFARTVNAAFCHPHPLGARFSSERRGAWYAGFAIATSLAEVVHHRIIEYAEVGFWHDEVSYLDHLADFAGGFHDLRDAERFARCLAPTSYAASQTLAGRLLDAGSLGVVYPSVRHAAGTCIACFRPSVVQNVRQGDHWTLTWSGEQHPEVRRGSQPRSRTSAARIPRAKRR